MTHLKEIKTELKEKGRYEKLSKQNVIVLQQAYVKDNPKCETCANTKNLSYDHIIPQQILWNFNLEPRKEFWEANSQTLCVACNHMKGGNLDLSNPKTKPLLLELINQI